MSDFQRIKLMVVSGLGLAKDGVHIYVGVAAFLFSVFVLRRSVRSFSALVPGLVLTLVAELIDLRDGAPGRERPRPVEHNADSLSARRPRAPWHFLHALLRRPPALRRRRLNGPPQLLPRLPIWPERVLRRRTGAARVVRRVRHFRTGLGHFDVTR